MFLLMMAIAGLGFLIKYILVPGFKRNEIYGNNTELYFWGYDRHQWGTVHLILGFILLLLLALHIILHWNMIKCILKKMIHIKKNRWFLSSILAIISIILLVGPLFIRTQIMKDALNREHYGRNETTYGNSLRQNHLYYSTDNTANITEKKTGKRNNNQISSNNATFTERSSYTVNVNGRVTLNQLAQKYNIPVNNLEDAINVPAGNSDINLGLLRKEYHFQLNEIRQYLESSIHENNHTNR